MILLREIQDKDLDALERFAQVPGFLSLPRDKRELKELIRRSQNSFSDKIANKLEGKYVFIAEELGDGTPGSRRALGTSMVSAQHGTAESPHFYFEIASEEKFSKTINTGFIHGTLKLRYDTNGPTEIGGLVIDPEHRNHDAKVGRQIAFVRFMYIALNKARFKKRIIAELLPPLDKEDKSPLWEAIGRRFTNMDYWEADRLCAKNKEFVLSLFPAGKIYTAFLSPTARDAIGKVGKATEPAWHMLTKIGFKYRDQVDPFDGGPHLWANVEELLPVRKLQTLSYGGVASNANDPGDEGLLSPARQAPGTFRAMAVSAVVRAGKVEIAGAQAADQTQAIEKVLEIRPGDAVAFMPYY